MKAQITMRSGAQVVVDVDMIKTSSDSIEGGLRLLQWETPTDWTAKLLKVDLAEVVAVVCLRESDEAGGAS